MWETRHQETLNMALHEDEVILTLNLLRDTPSAILNDHRDLALQTVTQIGRVLDISWDENGYLLRGISNASLENARIPETATLQIINSNPCL